MATAVAAPAAAAAAPLEPLQFAPCPGRLPSVVFWPCVTGYVTIGDRSSKAFMCAHTQSTFAKCQDLVDSQAGSVFVAAHIVANDSGRGWAFKFPYELVRRAERARRAAVTRPSQRRRSSAGCARVAVATAPAVAPPHL